MKFFDVIADSRGKYADKFFCYRGDDNIKKGDVVIIPFGRKDREIRGFVFGETEKPDIEEDRIKNIIGCDPYLSLTEEIIDVSSWMKKRYGIRYIDGLRLFVPKGKPGKNTFSNNKGNNLNDVSVNLDTFGPELTSEQKKAVNLINNAIEKNEQKNFLIHGVTGSGKTEVYMEAVKASIAKGRPAIVLVPEIPLAKQITERFINRFGKERIAIMHSKLTERKRFDQWIKIREGRADIIIGARIAAFAPVENPGVIIMDEEHETTYKSDMTPKYETVDIALKRMIMSKGVLILGSATPSVVSYNRAKEGIYTLIEMKERYNKVPMPSIDVVDMREELKEGNLEIFSGKLYNSIKENILKGKQVILFLNRRGYSTFVSCRECGYVLTCPECGISLTYHRDTEDARCHYCGRRFPVPKICPECGSRYIKYFGAGTEQVQETAERLFPNVKTERLDFDTVSKSGEVERILQDFENGEIQILVGTQLVAKGLDFRNVGVVGVIAADTSINLPDYRASERGFQLITQVAGRAGRGESQGQVIVQTYEPDSFVVKMASTYDYKGFYNREIQIRKLAGYPPFSDLIMVDVISKDRIVARKNAERLKAFLTNSVLKGNEKDILSPKISNIYRNKETIRYYILIKSPKGYRNRYMFMIDQFKDQLIEEKSDSTLIIDVNPYSII